MRGSGKPLVRYPDASSDASSHFGLTQCMWSQVGVFVRSATTPSNCMSHTVTEATGLTKRI